MERAIHFTPYKEELEIVIYALLSLINNVALQLLLLAPVKTLLGWVQHIGLAEN